MMLSIVPKVKIHRITCPYCIVGYAEIAEEISSGQTRIEGITEPRKCVACGNYFRLHASVKISGVRMEEGNGRK